MLKRKIINDFVVWKNKKDKKPLIVYGARQVGKTTAIREFGKNYYDLLIELNFITDTRYKDIFSNGLDYKTIKENLTLYTNLKIVPGRTLLFLDEIEECPNAITALKFLSMQNELDIISSGSLLGLHYKEVKSYPVGYVDYLKLYSLDFEEFLWAFNVDSSIINNLRDKFNKREKINDGINLKMLEYFRKYIVIGGMPEVVTTYLQNNDYNQVYDKISAILEGYRNDIAKYADNSEKTKATLCYDSIPLQLAKENKKFTYKVVEKNGRSSKYLGSLNWLEDANFITLCYNIKQVNLPLLIYKDPSSFKVYTNDTGLLLGMFRDRNISNIIINNDLGVYNGALIENVILKELLCHNHTVYYYNRNNSLEIDFIISFNGKPLPIECKASNNKAKSLLTFLKENPDLHGIKFINGNVGVKGNIISLPLYMVMFL